MELDATQLDLIIPVVVPLDSTVEAMASSAFSSPGICGSTVARSGAATDTPPPFVAFASTEVRNQNRKPTAGSAMNS